MNHSVYYTAEGPGVTMTPVGLLTLSREGRLKVNGPIDREVYPQLEVSIIKVYVCLAFMR